MNEFNTPQKQSVHSRLERPTAARDATTLPRLLLARSQKYADAIAISDSEGEYTYEATVMRAVGIAVCLRSRGATYNECVGLFLDSSADLPLAMWGILLSGAPYLPLATDYPQDRLAYMVKDAAVQLVVTNNRAMSKLDAILLPGVSVLNIDEIPLATANEVDQVFSELVEQDVDDLAYVIYTSGTTGKPKGVAISHRAIVSQMNWIASEGYLAHGDRIIQKTPVSFDAAQWELLGMCCGAHVVMGLPGVHRDPPELIKQIRRHGVTTLQGVPTLLQALTELPEFETCPSLHSVFSGGEALSRRLAKKLLDVLPGVRLVNLYGPTECTINATHYGVDESSFTGEWDVVPIGRAVGKLCCYVLNQHLEPVAPGETGELFVRGEQLANGYLFRPEQTDEKFPEVCLPGTDCNLRLYRTGDLVKFDGQGVLHFVGRRDNQVKYRGYRIELDEIRLAIENHEWVKSAAVFLTENQRTGQAQLVGAVELNPNEARLMDHGAAQSHHQTKSTRVQIRAQLSGGGYRSDASLADLPTTALLGKNETIAQRDRVFARKSYRFFHGGSVDKIDVQRWLDLQPDDGPRVTLGELDEAGLGEMLRYLGQFRSDERLLPKFAYASPGALYATQVYVELSGIAGLPSGVFYYHPAHHTLHRLSTTAVEARGGCLRLHFVGKVDAVREVYKNNILEVLEMETGHILGMLDHVLPEYGYAVGAGLHDGAVMAALQCPAEHQYIGTYDVVPLASRIDDLAIDVYVQAHGTKVDGLNQGTYRRTHGELQKVSDFIVEQRHVIAINQQSYQRASGGISLVSRSESPWRQYIDLGRGLQRLQMNRIGFGTMSSGYSSKSGNALATSLRLNDIIASIGAPAGPSYFFLFGKITAEQSSHLGMNEDAVHMKGPAELIRADLFASLPDYMVPSRLVIVNQMPQSASGKVDIATLKQSEAFKLDDRDRPVVAPRNAVEAAVCKIWRDEMGLEDVSISDNFFELGGDSLQAVSIAHAINDQFGTGLPIQVIFNAPTVEQLAGLIGGEVRNIGSRAVLLAGNGEQRHVFCWPGLGGYPMNLRRLGEAVTQNGRFYGIQSFGINACEAPFASIEAMAAADVEIIRGIQPTGPYDLWGYSFGARVAYEAAHQLEMQGESVRRLVLLAPGSPRLTHEEPTSRDEAALFSNKAFLTIALSVFSHDINEALTEQCLASVSSRDSFIAFAAQKFPAINGALLNAIINVVVVTYSPEYQISLGKKLLKCPIALWRAQGDGASFVSGGASAGLDILERDLAVGHYAVLQPEGISELLSAGLE